MKAGGIGWFFDCVWGFKRHRQPLRGHFVVVLPEKGRKEREERVEEMKERGQGKKRNRNESEETEEIKNIPPSTLTHYEDSRPWPNCKPISVGTPQ